MSSVNLTYDNIGVASTFGFSEEEENLFKNTILLQKEQAEVLLEKNHDYGRDNITKGGIEGLAYRLDDKVQRIKTLAKRPDHAAIVADEDIRKTFLDIANYGTIGMMLVDGTWQGAIPQLDPPQPLHPLTVYLGGPIDKLTVGDARLWRSIAKTALIAARITCYDPMSAFYLNSFREANAAFVTGINRAALFMSDIAFFNFPTAELGFGTAREIEFAKSLGKRVILSSEERIHSLEAHDLEWYPRLTTAIGVILEAAQERESI